MDRGQPEQAGVDLNGFDDFGEQGYQLLTEDVVPADPSAASPDSVSEHAVTVLQSDGASSDLDSPMARDLGETGAGAGMNGWSRLGGGGSMPGSPLQQALAGSIGHAGAQDDDSNTLFFREAAERIAQRLAGLGLQQEGRDQPATTEQAAIEEDPGWAAFPASASGQGSLESNTPLPQQQQVQQKAAALHLEPQRKEAIQAAMQGVRLAYQPRWAEAVPEGEWRARLAQRLGGEAPSGGGVSDRET